MKIMLDTNFILEMIKSKVSFEDIRFLGKIIIPKQVIDELEKISSEGNLKERTDSSLALQILSKWDYETIDLHQKFVDSGIRKYLEQSKEEIVLATFDKELKNSIPKNMNFLSIKAGKKLSID